MVRRIAQSMCSQHKVRAMQGLALRAADEAGVRERRWWRPRPAGCSGTWRPGCSKARARRRG